MYYQLCNLSLKTNISIISTHRALNPAYQILKYHDLFHPERKNADRKHFQDFFWTQLDHLLFPFISMYHFPISQSVKVSSQLYNVAEHKWLQWAFILNPCSSHPLQLHRVKIKESRKTDDKKPFQIMARFSRFPKNSIRLLFAPQYNSIPTN